MTRRGLATEFADDGDSTGLLLWRVTNRWQAAQRSALRPFGLTHVQFVLLASLVWLEGSTQSPITQRMLADQAATDPMMTSQVVRVLESKGWAERRPHATDGRAVVLGATEAGRELVNHAVGAVEGVDAQFFAALETRRDAFTAALRTLAG